METQGDLEETWFLSFCSCGQMKTAWMGEGLGWVIKNTTARQHRAHHDARGAQCFTLQSSVSTDLCICEINLFPYHWNSGVFFSLKSIRTLQLISLGAKQIWETFLCLQCIKARKPICTSLMELSAQDLPVLCWNGATELLSTFCLR